MEQKIKSSYINEIIFGFLGEIKKLEIIRYNKSFQKNLNININNYKKESKRYIIFESKTRGKEYNKLDHLIYEGEYLNGKRNGKGKEFGNFHEILFEGEYLNGKRSGKGKEYYRYPNDRFVQFEGEYSNGEKNGKGKEFIKEGKLLLYFTLSWILSKI